MALIAKLKDADYRDMIRAKWPVIHPDDHVIYERMMDVVQSAKGVGRKERAIWQRYIVYALKRK
jgi:hypothetical protein